MQTEAPCAAAVPGRRWRWDDEKKNALANTFFSYDVHNYLSTCEVVVRWVDFC